MKIRQRLALLRAKLGWLLLHDFVPFVEPFMGCAGEGKTLFAVYKDGKFTGRVMFFMHQPELHVKIGWEVERRNWSTD